MSHESKEAKSLSVAVDAHKTTLALATGTLVFSAGLLKEQIQLGTVSKYLLAVSWLILGISIVAGTLAYLRVPVMIREDKPNITDIWFKIPGQIHHVTFMVGVVVLGAAMIAILLTR